MELRIINKLKFTPLIILSFLAVQSCYYDNEEELYPGEKPCDTTNVTYSGTILPILQANCLGCHSGNTPQGNVSLDSYEAVKAAAETPVGSFGSLYGAISWASGNSNMPKNGNQLPECSIRQVKVWIDAGAPNN